MQTSLETVQHMSTVDEALRRRKHSAALRTVNGWGCLTALVTLFDVPRRMDASECFQQDPGFREGFDEHERAGAKVFAFARGQHNVLAASIESDPDFAGAAGNPAPTREINALCPSFRELMKAGIGSWPERDLLVLRAYERAGNFPHPPSSLALSPGRPGRAMIEQWRFIQLGNEAIAAAVTKRTGRSLLAK